MTDEEYWLTTEHVEVMLKVLRGKGSDRKLRLFTCHCCRDVEATLNERQRQAVALAEQYADGLADDVDREAMLCSLVEAAEGLVEYSRHGRACGYAMPYTWRSVLPVLTLLVDGEDVINTGDGRPIVGLKEAEQGYDRTRHVARWTAAMIAYERQEASRGLFGRIHEALFRVTSRLIGGYPSASLTIDGSYYREPYRVQLVRLRDIFGNPFRPIAFSASWRTDTAVALARQMYDSRDFGAMPILADAIQDAGCDSEDILGHCRDSNAMHVRGCWVVDLVLGKQ